MVWPENIVDHATNGPVAVREMEAFADVAAGGIVLASPLNCQDSASEVTEDTHVASSIYDSQMDAQESETETMVDTSGSGSFAGREMETLEHESVVTEENPVPDGSVPESKPETTNDVEVSCVTSVNHSNVLEAEATTEEDAGDVVPEDEMEPQKSVATKMAAFVGTNPASQSEDQNSKEQETQEPADLEEAVIVCPILVSPEEQDLEAPTEEGAFLGAVPLSETEIKESKAAEGAAAIDDAVSISHVNAPKHQMAENSVYSESGTEMDESIHGDVTTVAKRPGISGSGFNRHIQIYIFSFVILGLIIGSIIALLFGTGLIKGREGNSLKGAATPTSSPTAPPTSSETTSTSSPSASPSASPTAAPTADPLLNVLRFFSGTELDDTTSPQWQAYQWMRNEDPITNSADTDPVRIYQRYALATLFSALAGEMPSYASDDECDWPTVACGTGNSTSLTTAEDWQITELKLARQSFSGTIPSEIELFAPSLFYLDMAENDLRGSIPYQIYLLTRLKNLYLHDNAMTGKISEDVGNLQLLEDLYLGNNKFSGTIPMSLGSPDQGARVLRKVILHNNQMEGPVPANLNLPDAIYVDFSFNKFNGTLPQDIGQNFTSLRQLYLDHNEFTGTIPESYAMAGNGSLVSLYLNDNMLTGGLPTTWVDGQNKDATSSIDTINVEKNNMTVGIDKDVCRLSVFDSGKLVELKADCDICWCDKLCAHCWEK